MMINITDDQIVENNEDIRIAISFIEHNRINFDNATSIITIHDNDRRWFVPVANYCKMIRIIIQVQS